LISMEIVNSACESVAGGLKRSDMQQGMLLVTRGE